MMICFRIFRNERADAKVYNERVWTSLDVHTRFEFMSGKKGFYLIFPQQILKQFRIRLHKHRKQPPTRYKNDFLTKNTLAA